MINDSRPRGPRRRNPVTRAQIRRDAIWQILTPVAVALVVVFVIVGFVISASGAAVRSPLAAVSLMLLIVPTVILGVLVLALVVGLNYLALLGITRLPPYFKIAQDWVALVADRIQHGADSVSKVILKIRSTLAGVKRAADGVRGFLTFRR